MEKKYALVTITSPNFLAGTIVMLKTFFEYNSWFHGDIYIYSQDLSTTDHEILDQFPNVIFAESDKRLLSQIDLVLEASPKIAHKRMVFFSLNLFNLEGYDKYLYIDSDAFFRGTIEDLVKSSYEILFALDGTTYRGEAKNARTFKKVQTKDSESDILLNTFNAGIFFVDKKLVNKQTYQALLELVSPDRYVGLETLTTDQYLLNLYFRNQYTELPAKYNYRLNLSKAIKEREGTTYGKAKIIHFNGGKNPWMPKHAIQAICKHHTYRLAFLDWNQAYVEFIQSLHYKSFPKSKERRKRFPSLKETAYKLLRMISTRSKS